MSQSKRPERKSAGAPSQRPANQPQNRLQPQPGATARTRQAPPTGARVPQRRGAPVPPPPDPRPWYIWAAALVPVALALAWLFWPRGDGGTAVGTLPPGGARYMVIETDKGRIVARLYTEPEADVAATIANFESKANSGTFKGRVFHRVEEWVIQGGDPLGDGTGGGEMPARYNKIPYKTGSLGVARGPDPAFNNDSQFFIVKSGDAASSLTGKYTNFGEVVEGMEVVNRIQVGDKMNRVTVVEKP